MDENKLDAVRRAKSKVTSSMPSGVDIVGVGIGFSGNGPALKVNLRSPPQDRKLLPETIDGVPVTYDIVGKIKSRD
jgi:hypothetical protein